MEQTTAFPLFKLPFLALKPIIKQMELIKLLQISQLYKKARSIIKTCHKRTGHKMIVDISKYFTISITNPLFTVEVFPIELGGRNKTFVPTPFTIEGKVYGVGHDTFFEVYSDLWARTGMNITNELMDLFSTRLERVYFHRSAWNRHYEPDICKWLHSFGGSIDECHIFNKNSTVACAVLENGRFSKALFVDGVKQDN